MKAKIYILIARILWWCGKKVFRLADIVGEFWPADWMQKPLDSLADKLMGWSAKALMKGYWMIDPDADWDG